MHDEPRDWASRGLPPELDPRGPRRDAQRPPVGQRPTGGSSVLGRPPSSGRRAARALSWIAVVTSVAVLGVSGVGYAYLRSVGGDIATIEAFRDGADRPEAAQRGALNVLLVGSDSRGDLAEGEEYQGTGDEKVDGQRADTVILAHLFADSDQVQLVSFPRDSYVEIPAHTTEDGERVPETMGKLNRSFQVGGAPLLIETVERLTALPIDHYVQIDFEGFKDMVDAVDGVEVCLPEPAREPLSGIDLPAGRQTIAGDQALAFVRQRYGLPRGDLDRIARQQQFLGSLARKVLSSETLLNPLRIDDFVRSVADSLVVDEETSVGDLTQIAFRMRGFSAGGVSFSAVPVASIDASRKNADGLFESVVLIDEPAAESLFRDLRQDRAPGEPAPEDEDEGGATPAPVLIVSPEDVRVEVFNGAGIQGLGAQAADDLAEVGFTIAGPPGNRGSDETRTVVLHGPEKADSAATLAAAVPGATTELDPSLEGSRTVQLVLGSDYSGARAVSVAGSAPAPATEAPETPAARPTPQTAAQDPCAV